VLPVLLLLLLALLLLLQVIARDVLRFVVVIFTIAS
jgi:hypothetical protein